MASQQSTLVLSPQVLHCPPLHITKRTRRASLYRRLSRPSTAPRADYDSVCGPLDDIINQISTDIWRAPLDFVPSGFDVELEHASEALLTWLYPLKAPSTRTVTALPVSRIPSDQPLTIRKNRSSRSTGSGSSGSITMHHIKKFGKSKAPPADDNIRAYASSSSERPTKAARFLSGLKRKGFPNSSEQVTPSASAETLPRGDHGDAEDSDSDMSAVLEALEAFMQTKGKSPGKVKKLADRVAKHLPRPLENAQNRPGTAQAVTHGERAPTIVSATLDVIPDTRLLQEDRQEMHIAVDIIGSAHNLRSLADPAINAIFIIDNAYYVSGECLESAVETVYSALGLLSRGDRVAVFTTHCMHEQVASPTPDTIFPLRPWSKGLVTTWKQLSDNVKKHGSQQQHPARPNPAMSSVIEAVVRRVKAEGIDYARTHVIVLTPAMHELHGISKKFPKLSVYLINPALLAYRGSEQSDESICQEECCANVTVYGWTQQEQPAACVSQIIHYARFEKPTGQVLDLSVSVSAKEGVEILSHAHTFHLGRLKLGQTVRLFLHLRVTRHDTQPLNFTAASPQTKSYMDVTGLRHHLAAAHALGAAHAHLLDFAVVCHHSLLPPATWVYLNQPLLVWTRAGALGTLPEEMSGVVLGRAFAAYSEVGRFDAHWAVRNTDFLLREGLHARLGEMEGAAMWNAQARVYEAMGRGGVPLVREGRVDVGPECEELRGIWEMEEKEGRRSRGLGRGRGRWVPGLK